jgi:putative transposase
MFLTGISTRTFSMISKKLIARKISATETSNVNKELVEAGEDGILVICRKNRLSTFLLMVFALICILGKALTVPVLVAIGVKETGHKLVLGLQAGDKELAHFPIPLY